MDHVAQMIFDIRRHVQSKVHRRMAALTTRPGRRREQRKRAQLDEQLQAAGTMMTKIERESSVRPVTREEAKKCERHALQVELELAGDREPIDRSIARFFSAAADVAPELRGYLGEAAVYDYSLPPEIVRILMNDPDTPNDRDILWKGYMPKRSDVKILDEKRCFKFDNQNLPKEFACGTNDLHCWVARDWLDLRGKLGVIEHIDEHADESQRGSFRVCSSTAGPLNHEKRKAELRMPGPLKGASQCHSAL